MTVPEFDIQGFDFLAKWPVPIPGISLALSRTVAGGSAACTDLVSMVVATCITKTVDVHYSCQGHLPCRWSRLRK